MAKGIQQPSKPTTPNTQLALAGKTCAEIKDLAKFYKKRKHPLKGAKLNFTDALKALFPKKGASLFSVAGGMTKDIPLLSSAAAAAALITDPNAGDSLQGVWGAVARTAVSEVGNAAGNLTNQGGAFLDALQRIRSSSFDSSRISSSANSISALMDAIPNSLNSPGIQGEISQICTSFGGASDAVFATLEAANTLVAGVDALRDALWVPQNVLGAAAAALSGVQNTPKSVLVEALGQAGLNGSRQIMDQIRGAGKMKFSGPCSPTAFDELSVLANACKLIDQFYGTLGLGNADWGQLGTDFLVAVVTPSMLKLADKAAGYTAKTREQILDPVVGKVSETIKTAICSSSSNNLVSSALGTISTAIAGAAALTATVASLYDTGKKISAGFSAGLAAMNESGAREGVKKIVSGSLDKFMNAGALDMLGDGVADQLRALQECAKQTKNPLIAAVLQQEIQKAVDERNIKGYTKNSFSDSNYFFAKAAKLRNLYSKNNAFLLGEKG